MVAALQALAASNQALQGVAQLHSLPPTGPVRLARAFGWSLLSNFYQARRELEAVPAGEPLRERLAASIDPGFEAQRASCRERRAANLRILAETQPELARRLEAAPGDPFPCAWAVEADGRFGIVRLGDAGLANLPGPALTDESRRRVREVVAEGLPILFGGLGLGRHLEAALDAHPDLGLGREIGFYVLEPEAGVFEIHLLLSDLGDWCRRRNVRFFPGVRGREDYEAFLIADPSAVPSLRRLELGRGPPAGFEAETNRRLTAVHQRDLADWRAWSRELDPARLLARLRGEDAEPPRMLCFTSRFTTVLQHSSRDVVRAFRKLGWRAELAIESSAIGRYGSRLFSDAVARTKPDLIFGIDHLRLEYEEALPSNVPYVCWIQDNLPQLVDPRLVGRLSDHDFTYYAITPSWRERYLAAGYRELPFLFMAVDEDVFDLPDAPDPRFACELAFVSNVGMLVPVPGCPGVREYLMDAFRAEDTGTVGLAHYEDLARRAAARFGLAATPEIVRGLLDYTIVQVSRYVSRTEPVRWAIEAGVDVRLYGKGWDTIPDLAAHARGSVQNGRELRDLYHSASIHLHVNHYMNLHQRLFECLASGGFLLARAVASDRDPHGLGEHLEIGREIVTFDGHDDFLAKIAHYLSHEDERRRVIEAGRARVLAEHTYTHRMRRVAADVIARLEVRTSADPSA